MIPVDQEATSTRRACGYLQEFAPDPETHFRRLFRRLEAREPDGCERLIAACRPAAMDAVRRGYSQRPRP